MMHHPPAHDHINRQRLPQEGNPCLCQRYRANSNFCNALGNVRSRRCVIECQVIEMMARPKRFEHPDPQIRSLPSGIRRRLVLARLPEAPSDGLPQADGGAVRCLLIRVHRPIAAAGPGPHLRVQHQGARAERRSAGNDYDTAAV